MKKTALLLIFLLACGTKICAQTNDDEQDAPLNTPHKKPKFLTGLYVGSYFANKYTASMYNGYGYDLSGNQNSFTNSWINQRINMEYGGGYGQYDQVAAALGVDPGTWTFNESDMPFSMRYTPAIMVGANFKIPVNPKSSLLFNVNGTKLNAQGAFNITLNRPQNPNPANNTNILTFPIRGSEQRLLFQLGFQHLFGDDEKFNFILECGLTGTLSKFNQNTVYINKLTINLAQYTNSAQYYMSVPGRKPVGFGIGAYAGTGLNIDMSDKFNVQILYMPTYEKVNMGNNPTQKWQHSIGMRFYFKI